jgi:hypothetical protein
MVHFTCGAPATVRLELSATACGLGALSQKIKWFLSTKDNQKKKHTTDRIEGIFREGVENILENALCV